MTLLTHADTDAAVAGTDWHREGDELVLERVFADFAQAMVFAHQVAEAAQAADHHPDIHVHGWNHVRLRLATHSEGGITARDIALATTIDALQPLG